MIEFPDEVPNTALLRKTVSHSRKHRDPFPSLSELAPEKSLQELTETGRAWQKAGLGSMTEHSNEGKRSVSFTLNEDALKLADYLDAKTIIGQLKSLPLGKGLWEVTKLGLAALLGAVTQAYFGS